MFDVALSYWLVMHYVINALIYYISELSKSIILRNRSSTPHTPLIWTFPRRLVGCWPLWTQIWTSSHSSFQDYSSNLAYHFRWKCANRVLIQRQVPIIDRSLLQKLYSLSLKQMSSTFLLRSWRERRGTDRRLSNLCINRSSMRREYIRRRLAYQW